MERRLAAIVIADVVGFSKLIRADDECTFAHFKICRDGIEDRQRLNGFVEKVIQKGAYTRESLMAEVRNLVTTLVAED